MQPKWQFVLVVAAILLVNIVPGLVIAPHSLPGWRLVSWFATIALFLLALVVIGERMAADWRGVLVDKRNVISLSRLQLVIWTTIVVSGILTSAVVNVVAGAPDPLVLNIPPEIWALLGISGTSFVATPLILDRDPTTVSTNDAQQWAWADIFLGDKTDNDDKVDLSKVQQFFFTVIIVAIYMMKLGYNLVMADKVEFPPIDPGFVALLGISHAAYLIHKAS